MEVACVLIMEYTSAPSRDAYIVAGVLQAVPLVLLAPTVWWIWWRTRRVQWQRLVDQRTVCEGGCHCTGLFVLV